MKKNKGFGLLGVMGVIVVIAGIVGASLYVKSHVLSSRETSTSPSVENGTNTVATMNQKTEANTPYAGWKVYVSSLGFSIKYPSTWFFDERNFRFQSWSPSQTALPDIGGAISIVPWGVEVEDSQLERFVRGHVDASDSVTVMNLNNATAIKVTSQEGQESIWFSNGGRAFHMKYQEFLAIEDDATKTMIDQIIDSLQLLPPKETFKEEQSRILGATGATDSLAKAYAQGVQTLLAAYKKDKGNYPQSLAELTQVGLPTIEDLKNIQPYITYYVMENGQSYELTVLLSKGSIKIGPLTKF